MSTAQWATLIAAVAVPGALFVATRRAARRDRATEEQRRAARTLREALEVVGAEWSDHAVKGGGEEGYVRWVSERVRELKAIRPDVSPELQWRLDSLVYVLERSAALGGHFSTWVSPVISAQQNVQLGVEAALQEAKTPPRTFPDTRTLAELLDRDQRLKTGGDELQQWIRSRLNQIDRERRREAWRAGLQVGLWFALAASSLVAFFFLTFYRE